MSKKEDILEALKELLSGLIDETTVERNSVIPEIVPANGLIIIRDGSPGDPDIPLGGFSNAYYQHQIEVEIFVQSADQCLRDERFDKILMHLGQALESNRTLSGRIFGMTFGQPDVATESVISSDDIKAATLSIVLDYETPYVLS